MVEWIGVIVNYLWQQQGKAKQVQGRFSGLRFTESGQSQIEGDRTSKDLIQIKEENKTWSLYQNRGWVISAAVTVSEANICSQSTYTPKLMPRNISEYIFEFNRLLQKYQLAIKSKLQLMGITKMITVLLACLMVVHSRNLQDQLEIPAPQIASQFAQPFPQVATIEPSPKLNTVVTSKISLADSTGSLLGFMPPNVHIIDPYALIGAYQQGHPVTPRLVLKKEVQYAYQGQVNIIQENELTVGDEDPLAEGLKASPEFLQKTKSTHD